MILTDPQYQERLGRLAQLRVALDTDISAVTVKLLLTKLSTIQVQRGRASSALVEAINNKAEAKAIFDDAKEELDMQMDTLLATDENVKQQKTAEMRTSLASTKCADLAMKKHQAMMDSLRADSYFDAVYEVATDLKNTYDNLQEQIGLFRFGLEAGLLTLENFSKNDTQSGGSQQ